MRRLFILSALFSVLLAMSQPLFACPMDMTAGDCCPTGTHDPCDANALSGAACPDRVLCAGTPQDAAALIAQVQKEPQPALPGSAPGADPPPHPASGPRAPPTATVPTDRPAQHTDYAAISAALTWLHTARLRR